MKSLLTTTAIVALISFPALAQDSTAPVPTEPPAATAPAPDAAAPEILPEGTGAQPAGEAAPDVVAPDATVEAPAAPAADDSAVAAAETQTFVDRQGEGEHLATDWIGKTVYNGNEESLGDVNDLLFGEDGRLSAAILGVGGFLGIGEKEVAVSVSAIEERTDEDGDISLYLNATSEQLEAAPDFMTTADIRSEELARAAEQETLNAQPPAAPAPVQ